MPGLRRVYINILPQLRPCLGIEGEDESWDFGTGAGFYVDATAAPWATNYRMYSYVTKELPALIKANFNVNGLASVMGHRLLPWLLLTSTYSHRGYLHP